MVNSEKQKEVCLREVRPCTSDNTYSVARTNNIVDQAKEKVYDR